MNRGDYVTIIEIIHTKFRVIFYQNHTFFMNKTQIKKRAIFKIFKNLNEYLG